MSAGTPVIATDIPVCREVLDAGRCGLLVPPRNVEALADTIRRVLEDAALRERMTSAAFARAAELCGIQPLVNKYAALPTGNPGNNGMRS